MKNSISKFAKYVIRIFALTITIQCMIISHLFALNEVTMYSLKPIPVLNMDVTITGTVTDSDGEPIPGVTVSVPGTTIGTATDLAGSYTLSVPEGSTLTFSFIGFISQSIAVSDQSVIDVILSEDVASLDEVIVVGYGTQKRMNITGSVDMVTAEQLVDKPVATVGHALQGVIPNLNIEIPSGRPGTNPTFNVRGYESITGGSPLILVDGVPRSINDINTSDIESISVL